MTLYDSTLKLAVASGKISRTGSKGNWRFRPMSFTSRQSAATRVTAQHFRRRYRNGSSNCSRTKETGCWTRSLAPALLAPCRCGWAGTPSGSKGLKSMSILLKGAFRQPTSNFSTNGGKMKKVSAEEICSYIETHIPSFHKRRLESLAGLELHKVLKRKNPYLFKAKNITSAAELVKGILDAHLSSQEETIFGGGDV